MAITTEQLAALKEVAEKAREFMPGRWRLNFSTLHGHGVWAAHGSNGSMMVATMGHADTFDAANAAHAAAFDPTTCLELLEEVERGKAEVVRLWEECNVRISALKQQIEIMEHESQ